MLLLLPFLAVRHHFCFKEVSHRTPKGVEFIVFQNL